MPFIRGHGDVSDTLDPMTKEFRPHQYWNKIHDIAKTPIIAKLIIQSITSKEYQEVIQDAYPDIGHWVCGKHNGFC